MHEVAHAHREGCGATSRDAPLRSAARRRVVLHIAHAGEFAVVVTCDGTRRIRSPDSLERAAMLVVVIRAVGG